MFLQNSDQKNFSLCKSCLNLPLITINHSLFCISVTSWSFCQVKEILWLYLFIFCSPLFSVFSVFPSFEVHSIFTPFIYSLKFYTFLGLTRILFKSIFQFTIFFFHGFYFCVISSRYFPDPRSNGFLLYFLLEFCSFKFYV